VLRIGEKQKQKKAKTDPRSDDQQAANALRLERAAGIEPARKAWEAFRLPLHHARAAEALGG